jgi:inner membrane protein
MYLIWRMRGRKTNDPSLPPRWGLLFSLAYLAGLSHILLDFTNNYGVRPFWPFWEKWYSWDIVFIADPILWTTLILALVLPAFLSLINREIGYQPKNPRGRGAAIAALAVILLLWSVRDFEHRRAVHALHARTYEQADPLRVGAFPTFWNPFVWHGVVETTNFFALMEVDSLRPEVDPSGKMEVRYKPEETSVTLAAKKSYLGRVYLDWAEFPLVEVEPTTEGEYRVDFYDLRFASPLHIGGRRPLSAGVILDHNFNVISEFMGVPVKPPPE